MYLLWTHIRWRSHICLSILRMVVYGFSETEVSEFWVLAVIQEYVRRFYVPMQDHLFIFASVTLKESQDYLHKHFPNKIFSNVLVILSALLDQLRQVPTCTVLHYDIQSRVSLVYDLVIVPHNILVLKLSEYVDLSDHLLLLFFLHGSIIDLLPHHLLACLLVLHQTYFTKATYIAHSELCLPWPMSSLTTS